MVYLVIGKEGCTQCDVLKNILYVKNVPFHYVMNTELSASVIDILKGSYKTYPMVVEIKQFPHFQGMLSFFRDDYIPTDEEMREQELERARKDMFQKIQERQNIGEKK